MTGIKKCDTTSVLQIRNVQYKKYKPKSLYIYIPTQETSSVKQKQKKQKTKGEEWNEKTEDLKYLHQKTNSHPRFYLYYDKKKFSIYISPTATTLKLLNKYVTQVLPDIINKLKKQIWTFRHDWYKALLMVL